MIRVRSKESDTDYAGKKCEHPGLPAEVYSHAGKVIGYACAVCGHAGRPKHPTPPQAKRPKPIQPLLPLLGLTEEK